MRRTIALAVILVVSIAGPCAAQQSEEQVRKANRKINIGLVMMGAGALIAPLTAINQRSHPNDAVMTTDVGLIIVGSGVVWWGAMERRRALQPQTTIGVALGPRVHVRVLRTW